METNKMVKTLRGLQVQTGSLACLGCGHEHGCSTRGCAIIREAVEMVMQRLEEMKVETL